MKLLLDVNVGGTVTNWLKSKGYDVSEVKEIDMRMTDKSIMEWALKDKRIVVFRYNITTY
jgi:predicted nuclease of predicted toxin-antitoxin system